MAETIINSTEPTTHIDVLLDAPTSSIDGSHFCRRIEFHLARKPFTGFSKGGGDFRLETLNPSSKTHNPGANNQVTGPLPLVGNKQEENGLDPELSFQITFRRIARIGAGLQNLGNTCFLNSVLQCLTYTEPLAAYLESGKHQISCRTAGFCALCAIQRHVSRALQSTGRILAPKELVSNLRCISRNFRNSRQEDAHEYMVNFLEAMHKCCLPAGVPSESPSAFQTSLIHKIFGGRLRSQVKCMQCNHCSDTFDPFLDLSLEIVRADSLQKALAHFTAKEQLDGGEKHYQCERCKQKVKALKQLTIHKVPDVLIIHLKRFGSHIQGQKIDKKILFGPTIDMAPFVTGPYDGDLKYNLFGVLVHAGWSTHSGHYFSFVRTSSGMWYNLDDNQVVQVSEKRVLEQKAYMLFYSRDRRHLAPKKPIHIVQKESITTNGVGRSDSFSNFNGGLNRRTLNNGPVEIRLDSPNSSGCFAQQFALKANISKDTPVNTSKKTTSTDYGLVVAQGSPCNKDQNGGGNLPQYDKASSGTSKLSNASNTKANASTSTSKLINASNTKANASTSTKTQAEMVNSVAELCKGNASESMVTKNDLNNSAATSVNDNANMYTKCDISDSFVVPFNCPGPHNSAAKTSVENGFKVSSLDVVGRILENIEPNSQTGAISQNNSGGDLISEDAGTKGHGSAASLSAILSSSLMPTLNNHEKTHECRPHQKHKKTHECRPHQKHKKKHLIHASMHLSSNILFGSSLKPQKKKQKRSRTSKLQIKNPSQEKLLNENVTQTDLGPSTSEKIRTIIPLGDLANTKRRAVSGSKKTENILVKNADVANSNSDVLTVDKEFRERNHQNGAVLAASNDEMQKTSGNCLGKEVDGTKDERTGSNQNGLMNMLTRGLEDTIVKRWDDMESYPPVMAEESNGRKSVTIGYIGDEWDEEYDRGKRKKVRGIKDKYSGPNPFQEIATTKANHKKAKFHHSTSTSLPFKRH